MAKILCNYFGLSMAAEGKSEFVGRQAAAFLGYVQQDEERCAANCGSAEDLSAAPEEIKRVKGIGFQSGPDNGGDDPFRPKLRLIDLEKPVLTIPRLAIHMNRKANQGIDLLRQELLRIAGWHQAEDVFIARERHLRALAAAQEHVAAARSVGKRFSAT